MPWITQETPTAVILTAEVGLMSINYSRFLTLPRWQGQAMIHQFGNESCLMAAILLSVRGQVSCAGEHVFVCCSDSFANQETKDKVSDLGK